MSSDEQFIDSDPLSASQKTKDDTFNGIPNNRISFVDRMYPKLVEEQLPARKPVPLMELLAVSAESSDIGYHPNERQRQTLTKQQFSMIRDKKLKDHSEKQMQKVREEAELRHNHNVLLESKRRGSRTISPIADIELLSSHSPSVHPRGAHSMMNTSGSQSDHHDGRSSLLSFTKPDHRPSHGGTLPILNSPPNVASMIIQHRQDVHGTGGPGFHISGLISSSSTSPSEWRHSLQGTLPLSSSRKVKLDNINREHRSVSLPQPMSTPGALNSIERSSSNGPVFISPPNLSSRSGSPHVISSSPLSTAHNVSVKQNTSNASTPLIRSRLSDEAQHVSQNDILSSVSSTPNEIVTPNVRSPDEDLQPLSFGKISLINTVSKVPKSGCGSNVKALPFKDAMKENDSGESLVNLSSTVPLQLPRDASRVPSLLSGSSGANDLVHQDFPLTLASEEEVVHSLKPVSSTITGSIPENEDVVVMDCVSEEAEAECVESSHRDRNTSVSGFLSSLVSSSIGRTSSSESLSKLKEDKTQLPASKSSFIKLKGVFKAVKGIAMSKITGDATEEVADDVSTADNSPEIIPEVIPKNTPAPLYISQRLVPDGDIRRYSKTVRAADFLNRSGRNDSQKPTPTRNSLNSLGNFGNTASNLNSSTLSTSKSKAAVEPISDEAIKEIESLIRSAEEAASTAREEISVTSFPSIVSSINLLHRSSVSVPFSPGLSSGEPSDASQLDRLQRLLPAEKWNEIPLSINNNPSASHNIDANMATYLLNSPGPYLMARSFENAKKLQKKTPDKVENVSNLFVASSPDSMVQSNSNNDSTSAVGSPTRSRIRSRSMSALMEEAQKLSHDAIPPLGDIESAVGVLRKSWNPWDLRNDATPSPDSRTPVKEEEDENLSGKENKRNSPIPSRDIEGNSDDTAWYLSPGPLSRVFARPRSASAATPLTKSRNTGSPSLNLLPSNTVVSTGILKNSSARLRRDSLGAAPIVSIGESHLKSAVEISDSSPTRVRGDSVTFNLTQNSTVEFEKDEAEDVVDNQVLVHGEMNVERELDEALENCTTSLKKNFDNSEEKEFYADSPDLDSPNTILSKKNSLRNQYIGRSASLETVGEDGSQFQVNFHGDKGAVSEEALLGSSTLPFPKDLAEATVVFTPEKPRIPVSGNSFTPLIQSISSIITQSIQEIDGGGSQESASNSPIVSNSEFSPTVDEDEMEEVDNVVDNSLSDSQFVISSSSQPNVIEIETNTESAEIAMPPIISDVDIDSIVTEPFMDSHLVNDDVVVESEHPNEPPPSGVTGNYRQHPPTPLKILEKYVGNQIVLPLQSLQREHVHRDRVIRTEELESTARGRARSAVRGDPITPLPLNYGSNNVSQSISTSFSSVNDVKDNAMDLNLSANHLHALAQASFASNNSFLHFAHNTTSTSSAYHTPSSSHRYRHSVSTESVPVAPYIPPSPRELARITRRAARAVRKGSSSSYVNSVAKGIHSASKVISRGCTVQMAAPPSSLLTPLTSSTPSHVHLSSTTKSLPPRYFEDSQTFSLNESAPLAVGVIRDTSPARTFLATQAHIMNQLRQPPLHKDTIENRDSSISVSTMRSNDRTSFFTPLSAASHCTSTADAYDFTHARYGAGFPSNFSPSNTSTKKITSALNSNVSVVVPLENGDSVPFSLDTDESAAIQRALQASPVNKLKLTLEEMRTKGRCSDSGRSSLGPVYDSKRVISNNTPLSKPSRRAPPVPISSLNAKTIAVTPLIEKTGSLGSVQLKNQPSGTSSNSVSSVHEDLNDSLGSPEISRAFSRAFAEADVEIPLKVREMLKSHSQKISGENISTVQVDNGGDPAQSDSNTLYSASPLMDIHGTQSNEEISLETKGEEMISDSSFLESAAVTYRSTANSNDYNVSASMDGAAPDISAVVETRLIPQKMESAVSSSLSAVSEGAKESSSSDDEDKHDISPEEQKTQIETRVRALLEQDTKASHSVSIKNAVALASLYGSSEPFLSEQEPFPDSELTDVSETGRTSHPSVLEVVPRTAASLFGNISTLKVKRRADGTNLPNQGTPGTANTSSVKNMSSNGTDPALRISTETVAPSDQCLSTSERSSKFTPVNEDGLPQRNDAGDKVLDGPVVIFPSPIPLGRDMFVEQCANSSVDALLSVGTESGSLYYNIRSNVVHSGILEALSKLPSFDSSGKNICSSSSFTNPSSSEITHLTDTNISSSAFRYHSTPLPGISNRSQDSHEASYRLFGPLEYAEKRHR